MTPDHCNRGYRSPAQVVSFAKGRWLSCGVEIALGTPMVCPCELMEREWWGGIGAAARRSCPTQLLGSTPMDCIRSVTS